MKRVHKLAAAAAFLAAASLFFIHPAVYAAIPTANVIFGGDMMFDRTIRTTIDAKGGDFVFSCIDATLQHADMVVANLEGPITENASRSVNSLPGDGNNYTFTFSTSTAPLLAAHKIGIVNIGNNHIENFGVKGLQSTIQALENAGVAYFGLPAEASAQAGDPLMHRVAKGRINGISLTFVNYNEFIGGDASSTIAQIKQARIEGYLPVVYTHWGIEYSATAPERIHTLAHQFVDAGAEIVIGSHPHVVEESEVYQGKYIYYSLGNFIFDQYWNPDVRHGLLLDVVFDPAGVHTVKEIPVELGRDRRTCPTS